MINLTWSGYHNSGKQHKDQREIAKKPIQQCYRLFVQAATQRSNNKRSNNYHHHHDNCSDLPTRNRKNILHEESKFSCLARVQVLVESELVHHPDLDTVSPCLLTLLCDPNHVQDMPLAAMRHK